MSGQRLRRVLVMGALVLVMSLATWATSALAQCGGDQPPQSSCCACHAGAHPVSLNNKWHQVHANKDCCWNCHGGNDTTQDKELAHVGLVLHPLDDIYTKCHACHRDNYQQRAEQFALAMGATPTGSKTPTPLPVTPTTSGQTFTPSPLVTASPQWTAMLVLLVLLAIFFASVTVAAKRRAQP